VNAGKALWGFVYDTPRLPDLWAGVTGGRPRLAAPKLRDRRPLDARHQVATPAGARAPPQARSTASSRASERTATPWSAPPLPSPRPTRPLEGEADHDDADSEGGGAGADRAAHKGDEPLFRPGSLPWSSGSSGVKCHFPTVPSDFLVWGLCT
jgi:hypothetical protein